MTETQCIDAFHSSYQTERSEELCPLGTLPGLTGYGSVLQFTSCSGFSLFLSPVLFASPEIQDLPGWWVPSPTTPFPGPPLDPGFFHMCYALTFFELFSIFEKSLKIFSTIDGLYHFKKFIDLYHSKFPLSYFNRLLEWKGEKCRSLGCQFK